MVVTSTFDLSHQPSLTRHTSRLNMPKPKILFITKRLPNRPTDDAIQQELQEKFPQAASLPAEPYPQPDHCPIELPLEFRDDQLLSDTFRLAVHESSHALANLLWSGRVDAVVLTSSVEGGGSGRSYGWDGDGEDGARVGVAGMAGERLIQGVPLPISGFKSDIESARADLRTAKVRENDLDERAQSLYREVQKTFSKDWVPALTAAAIELTKRGILDGKTLLGIFSNAQADSNRAGMLAKAFSNVKIGTGKAHVDLVTFRLNHFEALAKSIQLSRQANTLKSSLTDPNLSAVEVLQRSIVADHLERRSSLLGGT